jgi:hypothetical protein
MLGSFLHLLEEAGRVKVDGSLMTDHQAQLTTTDSSIHKLQSSATLDYCSARIRMVG